ncbi:DUF6714 family protein [Haloferula sp. BvORR071]|uniref:DUF6714 family protein n=1 Tax=Haloferula sp. BvORR071 TaxID=1396141 RepID=UPI000558DB7A|nr:DUF6714 family protein [Haloferula sp. BvORR071]
MFSYEEHRKQTIACIEEAFLPDRPAHALDPHGEKLWQEVSGDELDEAYKQYAFLGQHSLRFYLPALMRRRLEEHSAGSGSFDADYILLGLSCGPGFFHCGPSSFFRPEEETAIAAFLFFISRNGHDLEQQTAAAALEIGWWKHLPEFAFSD